MIFIKNFTIFKCSRKEKYHWSKLPKLIKLMRRELLYLRGADLRGADLREADLCGANLREADLYGADLRGADLRGADLCGANLYGADLREADLREANLREADLCEATKKTPEKLTIKDFMSVQGLGSQNRTTYFYDTEEIGIVVQCGCFYGTEKAFKKQVKETHKDGQFAKEYLSMLKVVKIRFSREKQK